MLSPNSTLQDARYRISRNLWDTPENCLYEALDARFGKKVLILETRVKGTDVNRTEGQLASEFDRLRTTISAPFVSLRDRFDEGDFHYATTHSVAGRLVSEMAAAPARSFDPDRVLHGLTSIIQALVSACRADRSLQFFGSGPQSVLVNDDGTLEYVFFRKPTVRNAFPQERLRADLAFAFLPLEAIWLQLDHASQKAISNSHDELSLESLESAPDLRTDLATLGSITYFLLTGVVPHGALERSIEMLDGKPDPLITPYLLNPAVSPEASAALMKAMNLKRHERFSGLDAFLHELESVLPKAPTSFGEPADAEDIDLLEIPVFSTAAASAASQSSHLYRGAPANDLVAVSTKFEAPLALATELTTEQVVQRVSEEQSADTLSVDDAAVPFPDEDQVIFSGPAQTRSWFLNPAAIAAAVLVIVGIAGWFTVSTLSAAEPSDGDGLETRTVISSPPIVQQPKSVEPPVQQVADQAPQSDAGSARSVTPSSEQTDRVGMTAKRAPAPEVKARTEPKPAAPESAAKQKKKVTVDDLISDN